MRLNFNQSNATLHHQSRFKMGCTAAKEKPAGNSTTKTEQQGASGNQKKVKAKYYMKVLMVGTSACGKSTVAKQMKILHCNGFTPEERDNYKKILISNIFLSLKELVTQAQLLKIDIKEESIAEEIDKLDPFAVTITPQLIQDINKLWEDKGNALNASPRYKSTIIYEGTNFYLIFNRYSSHLCSS